MTDRTFRVREFAALAGVTVRALHHYDRLGVLKPRRTDKGYRVYSAKDLEALEHIVALKFIGLPLAAIKPLVRKGPSDLASLLRTQRVLLEHKKALLDTAIATIREAEETLWTAGHVDGGVFKRIIEVIEMQNKSDEWKQKYDTLVQGKIDRLKAMTPEERAQLQQQWTDLFTDVGKVLDQDPASASVQALADRWVKLLGAFAPAGAALDTATLKEYGAANQPSGAFGDPRVWTLMRKALAVRT